MVIYPIREGGKARGTACVCTPGFGGVFPDGKGAKSFVIFMLYENGHPC